MTLRDPEVLLEFRDEPQLLAIADALADVLVTVPPATRRTRRGLSLALAACLAATAALLALVFLGGKVHQGVVDKALAAVGDGPVLHAVLREKLPPTYSLVEIATGRRIMHSPTRITEVWFDEKRGLKHTITRTDGAVDDELATPEGITTQDGPVWTCARIARHPVEATRVGVSCNLSGDNGTTPRNVPERRPAGDPALLGFVDGYRAALASGAARKIGEGRVAGTEVYWLEFKLPDPDGSDGNDVTDLREQVAVATDTYRPIVVRTLVNGTPGEDLRVVSIETVSRGDANFVEPKLIPPGQREEDGWDGVGRERISLAEASNALGVRALWAGPAVQGRDLAFVERREIAFSSGGSGERSRASAILLHYGALHDEGGPSGALQIVESSEPIAYLTFFPGAPSAPRGFMTIGPLDSSFVRMGSLYVGISGFSRQPETQTAILAAARHLRPVSESG
jgi:hypothetical protein